jgi:hypothetical protein
MKRNEIIGEHKKGVKAVKYAKKPNDPTKVHAKAKEKLQPVKPMEGRFNRDAYQRDYDSSISGMDGSDRREFKRREMEHELGHETNNYAVAIDGRTWKVFASKSHAQAVARSLQNKGKKASVHETGAEPTTEAAGMPVGKIAKIDPATKKATIAKPDGTTIDIDSTALTPTTDGKMQMDAPDPNDLKTGSEVVSKEEALVSPPTDSMSPIHGSNNHNSGEHNEIIHLLKRLAGMGMKMKGQGGR